MKLASIFLAAAAYARPSTVKHYNDDDYAAFVARRTANTRRFTRQLRQIVPDITFGNFDGQIDNTMKILAPLPSEELARIKDELDAFFYSILTDDLNQSHGQFWQQNFFYFFTLNKTGLAKTTKKKFHL